MICNADMMHGHEWEGERIVGWYGSEKLDGCRARWDGRTFWTRGGSEVANVPQRIRDAMPPFHLDGEFFAGRGRLEEAKAAVQYGRFTDRVQFVVFDAPDAAGDWLARIRFAARHYQPCVTPQMFAGKPQLGRAFRLITEAGGEGLVIHQPGAPYVARRVRSVLKVKDWTLFPI
jgi:DNA ligase-1